MSVFLFLLFLPLLCEPPPDEIEERAAFLSLSPLSSAPLSFSCSFLLSFCLLVVASWRSREDQLWREKRERLLFIEGRSYSAEISPRMQLNKTTAPASLFFSSGEKSWRNGEMPTDFSWFSYR